VEELQPTTIGRKPDVASALPAVCRYEDLNPDPSTAFRNRANDLPDHSAAFCATPAYVESFDKKLESSVNAVASGPGTVSFN